MSLIYILIFQPFLLGNLGEMPSELMDLAKNHHSGVIESWRFGSSLSGWKALAFVIQEVSEAATDYVTRDRYDDNLFYFYVKFNLKNLHN